MNEATAGSPKTPLFTKLFYTAITLLLFLLLIETVLRVAGLFEPVPYFIEKQGPDGKILASFNQNSLGGEFLKKKPEGVFRIMFAGGSSTIGFPFQPRSAPGDRLEELLESMLRDMEVEVIPIGRMSMYSSEVQKSVQASLKYGPDLIVVYTGHNEFISLKRRLPPGMERSGKLLDRIRIARAASGMYFALARNPYERAKEEGLTLRKPPPLSKKQYQRATGEYRRNLDKIAKAAQENDTPLMLCTLGANLSDWPPEETFPADFTEKMKKDSRELLDRAAGMLEDNQPEKAAELLEKRLHEFPAYAPLNYLEGIALLQAKDINENQRQQAYGCFKKAVSNEAKTVVSHRAPPEFNLYIRKLASRKGVFIADVEEAMLNSTEQVPGFDLFVDHCHPDLNSQQIMAAAMAKALRKNSPPALAGKWKRPGKWNEQKYRQEHKLDGNFLHRAYLNIGIFNGIKKRFPNQCRELRDILRLSYEADPNNPLPLLLETMVASVYQDSEKPAHELAGLYAKDPSSIETLVNVYLTERADIREGVLLFRADPEAPPLSGVVKRQALGKKGMKDKSMNKKPDEYYNRFLDLAGTGKALKKQQ